MSEDERNSILDDLRIVKRFLGWLLAGVGALALTMVTVAISDHFLLRNVSDDVSAMKPRVEKLWWNSALSKSE